MISILNINPTLSYSMSGLNQLKSKIYQLLAQAYEQGGQVSITIEDLRVWLRDLDFAERNIQQIFEDINKKRGENK